MQKSQVVPIALAERTRPTSQLMLGSNDQLALLRRVSVEPHRPVPVNLMGRCKGRGVRLGGMHVAYGTVYAANLNEVETGSALKAFVEGSILVASALHPNWMVVALAAGGLIIDDGNRQGAVAKFAVRHQIPLILGLPNAGQFVHGERVYMMGDGRVMASIEATVASGHQKIA